MNTCEDVDVLIERMAKALGRQIESRGLDSPVMVGIRTGGVWVAERLHRLLGIEAPLGALNINFYRDDFTRIGMHPQVTPSDLPFSVDERHILLVDDVLFTGRTIRAALNEIFDYGRPASVTLAVLVERNGREIPVQADVVGQSLTLSDREYVKLRGPDPLRLEMTTRDR
ncbi:MAG: bifunctional pyr operon transcriptional regulator/uracil phosphoribosyltransferase PyrR [Gammaproteobacteria bacterium]|nr:bifunctional pyr operon transcriptional regulator/uracil phosphoribosyltransferase PyrR [Gammaproteobacteria bacterium]